MELNNEGWTELTLVFHEKLALAAAKAQRRKTAFKSAKTTPGSDAMWRPIEMTVTPQTAQQLIEWLEAQRHDSTESADHQADLLCKIDALEFALVKVLEYLDATAPGSARAVLAELELEGQLLDKEIGRSADPRTAGKQGPGHRDLADRIRSTMGMK